MCEILNGINTLRGRSKITLLTLNVIMMLREEGIGS